MSKKIIVLMLLTFQLIFKAEANSVFDPVVATVNLTNVKLIKLKDYKDGEEVAIKQLGRELTTQEKNYILDTLISNELIYQEAKRDGTKFTKEQVTSLLREQFNSHITDEELKSSIEKEYGKSWDLVLVDLVERFTIDSYMRKLAARTIDNSKLKPTDKEIEKFYLSNKTKFVTPDMVRIKHIFLNSNSSKKIDEIFKLIDQEQDNFDELSKRFSEDKESVKKGGDLGYIYRNNERHIKLLGAEFIDIIFSLPLNNKYTVIKSKAGDHIVQVTDKQDARILNLDDFLGPTSDQSVRDYISNSIEQTRHSMEFEKVTKELIKKLKSEAKVRKFDKNIPWD